MFCPNCGKDTEDDDKFCKWCGKKLIDGGSGPQLENEKVANNTKSVKVNSKQVLYKNKPINKWIVIGVVLGIIAILSVSISKYNYNKSHVSNNIIRQDFIGSNFNIGSMVFNITEKNLKSIEIIEEINDKELGVRSSIIEGYINVENEKYKARVPFGYVYEYNATEKRWILIAGEVYEDSEAIEIEFKEELTEDLIKESLQNLQNNGQAFTSEILDGISVEAIDEMEFGTANSVALTIEISRDLISLKDMIYADFIFDGEKWIVDNIREADESREVVVHEPKDSMSTEMIKSDLSIIFNKNREFYGYYIDEEIMVLLEDINEITNLKVESSGEEYTITAGVTGENEELKFKGNLEILVKSDGYTSEWIDYNNIEFKNSEFESNNINYIDYFNDRFGYSISYPSILTDAIYADNGDGVTLKNLDSSVVLKVFGKHNVLLQSLDELYEETLSYANNVTYNTKGNNWYVVSWEDGTDIYYSKVFVVNEEIYTFEIKYPKKYEAQFNPIVTKLYESFKKN